MDRLREAIQTVQRIAGDDGAPVTHRQIMNWCYVRLPLHGQVYVLAAARHLGVSITHAVRTCPDLGIVLHLLGAPKASEAKAGEVEA